MQRRATTAAVEEATGETVKVDNRYSVGEHLIVMARAVPAALRFLSDRLSRAPT